MRFRHVLWIGVVLAVAVALAFWQVTAPETISAEALPRHAPDVANGEYVYYEGGCSSCHAAPASNKCDDPKTADKKVLAGGRCLRTPFGAFYVPNISSDKQAGIGGWTDLQFVNAMMRGVSPSGQHYYPAFPYTSYQRMTYADALDLRAYLATLPAVATRAPDHDLPFPFGIRRGLGLWKLLYLDHHQFSPDPTKSAEINRGAYIVQGPGHCSECHTSRNLLGGKDESKAFAGAPNPEGRGVIPNITPNENGLGKWTQEDIAYFLETGNDPDFDSVGGAMVKVQENLALLNPEDRNAIAAYLKSLPPLPNAVSKAKVKKPEADAPKEEGEKPDPDAQTEEPKTPY